MAVLALSLQAHAAPANRVVRVGFFEFEGYHEIDTQNRRSGYGYEYLHEMAKYTGWVFEYVHGTWEECQRMLKDGEIDLLTSAQHNESRDKVFDFSTIPLGTSYAQLTVRDSNASYGRNDFAQFSGMRIGLLKGNSRNARLAEFAAEKQFTFRATEYETQQALLTALHTGAVDAVLTSSLRKLKNESIIAQFAPSPFYAVVKKGNTPLLQEVNQALEAVEMNNPAFRYTLYQKFYREDINSTFVLSRDEKEYLKTRPVIRAVIRPDVAPISYWQNGTFQGVAADIMAHLLSGLNIQVEFIRPKTLTESYEMLTKGTADIACLFESDYNLAEQYRTRITTPYLKTNYSLITQRQGDQGTHPNPVIAVAEGGLMGIRNAQFYYPHAKLLPVISTGAAIEAVVQGKADMALVNVYSAEKEMAKYPTLRASFISDDAQHFSIGVSQDVDPRLFSILDKKISAMDSQTYNNILARNTLFQQTPMSLTAYLQQHPVEVMLAGAAFFALVTGILLYIILTNRRHARSMYNLAYVDKLTALWNTNGFLLHARHVLLRNPHTPYAVVAVDLSNFSGINEDYGRHVGDKVILALGAMLNRFSNAQTVVAHAEADHFLLLLNYKNQEELHTTLTAIASMLSACTVGELQLRLRPYIGVGFVETHNNIALEATLLQAKDHAGMARHECTPDDAIIYMDKTLQTSLMREKEIRDYAESALQRGEFQVYYQPKVDMQTQEIIGAESLIRWNHSKLGFLSPAEFLPILEQNGFITELDFFVLEQACRLIRKRIDSGLPPLVISVNQSRTHFIKSDYLERLHNMLIRYDIPRNHIELEITETLFGQEAISDEIIKKLKSIGLLISIDDFGSGYSSLHLLHQISVDVLKIDKGLLDESGKQEKMRNIVRRVIQIATDLGVEVICEGVETREQVDFLLGADCKYAQGYLFSKPLPQDKFEELIQHKTVRAF